MTNTFLKPKKPSFDPEWEELLVGIRMMVEECWWDSYSSTALCPGTIVFIDYETKEQSRQGLPCVLSAPTR